jgi:DMSO/TMAO reductase YedYZ molybdopterin-dependent catalytic subunit
LSNASLDRILAVLVGLAALTGLLALRSGSAGWAWVFLLHGLGATALAILIGAKVARSLPRAVRARRWTRLAVSMFVTTAAVVALVAGFAWVAGGRILSVGPLTLMSWHAVAGLVLLPLLAVHLVPRRWRLLRPGERAVARAGERVLTRRALLVGGGLGAVAVAAYGLTDLSDRLLGGARRFTGSRLLAAGGIPPTTTFLGDTVPAIDTNAWRLRVHGAVARPAAFALADLQVLGLREQTATLDCTSGWAIETRWRGVAMSDLLAAVGPTAGARRLDVRSATGWGATFDLDQATDTLLAFDVAGLPLPAANGAPCRLVVPDRRGLDWVKWVTEIEIS